MYEELLLKFVFSKLPRVISKCFYCYRKSTNIDCCTKTKTSAYNLNMFTIIRKEEMQLIVTEIIYTNVDANVWTNLGKYFMGHKKCHSKWFVELKSNRYTKSDTIKLRRPTRDVRSCPVELCFSSTMFNLTLQIRHLYKYRSYSAELAMNRVTTPRLCV